MNCAHHAGSPRTVRRTAWLPAVLLFAGGLPALAQNTAKQPAEFDRVVAVVNNRAILSSDVADALRYSILEPESRGVTLTPQRALEQLISRNLIQQQIREEDLNASQPTEAQVEARIRQIRRDLPVCAREHCASDEGWDAFLIAHGLTATEVEAYERVRLEILHFIETRFRQGIRISDDDTQTYYRDNLLPQYAKGGNTPPPLAEVEPRIQEILLQQQVNALFTSWLDSLRKQGDVEILDPALESAQRETNADRDDQ